MGTQPMTSQCTSIMTAWRINEDTTGYFMRSQKDVAMYPPVSRR